MCVLSLHYIMSRGYCVYITSHTGNCLLVFSLRVSSLPITPATLGCNECTPLQDLIDEICARSDVRISPISRPFFALYDSLTGHCLPPYHILEPGTVHREHQLKVFVNTRSNCAHFRGTNAASYHLYYKQVYNYTVEPPLKETPNKGNLSIMNRITCPKKLVSYSANTFITSEERKPLYNEQNNLSQKLRYSEVPLYHHCLTVLEGQHDVLN